MMAKSYDVVIVGGGMNGVNIASHLMRAGLPSSKLLIIDRHQSPVLLWFEMTRQVGMEQVRSPIFHHLGGIDDNLETFIANKCSVDKPYDYADRYRRLCLPAFNQYLKNFIAKYNIDNIFQQGVVVGAIPLDDGGFEIIYKGPKGAQVISTKHLILSVGYHDNRYIPAWNQSVKDIEGLVRKCDIDQIRWIQELKQSGADVHHVYEPEFDIDELADDEPTVVVGGGFSGVQLALKLAEKQVPKVVLLVEYPITVHLFDADPAWADSTSAEMSEFLHQSYAQRRQSILQARNQGSVSPELQQKLQEFVKSGKLTVIVGDTQTAHFKGEKISLHVAQKAGAAPLSIETSRVILATGYRLNIRPGGALIDDLQNTLELPTYDGYPVLDDKTLRWGMTHQLYVAGQLAELTLGPLARNIAGTQLSANRIVNAPTIRSTIRRYAYKGVAYEKV